MKQIAEERLIRGEDEGQGLLDLAHNQGLQPNWFPKPSMQTLRIYNICIILVHFILINNNQKCPLAISTCEKNGKFHEDTFIKNSSSWSVIFHMLLLSEKILYDGEK